MSIYVVTRISDSAEIYRYNSDSAIEWQGMEFATHNHSLFIDPSDPVVATVVPTRIWEPIEFMRRFTETERKAIWAAQLVNADIDDAIKLLVVATQVHSNDVDVVRMVNAFELMGLIGSGRANEVLNGN